MSRFEPIHVATAHSNPNVKPLAQAWGDPVTATNLAESAGPNVQRAGLLSTAPMIDWDARNKADEEQRMAALAAKREIKAAREAGIARSEANVAIENRRYCGKDDCRAPARKDSEFCRWHQPKNEAE